MQTINPGQGRGGARQRILEAAIRHFSQASFDEVALRDIAADVGVDVAYVHRSFGSKDGLFEAVLEAIGKDAEIRIGPEGIAATLVDRLFDRNFCRGVGGVDDTDRLLVLIRSLSNQRLGPMLGARLESQVIEPVRIALGDETQFRAASVISLMIGFRITRNLLQLQAVNEIDEDEGRMLVTRAIEAIIAATDPAAEPRG